MKTRLPEVIRFEIEDAMLRRDWRKVEEVANADLRHQSGAQPIDYLKQWCNVARIFAVATQDYTWGEFEKEFAIIVRNAAKFKVLAELIREFEGSANLEKRDSLRREMAAVVEAEQPAAGSAPALYPQGQYGPNDQGEIEIKIAADPANHKVIIEFGKPVQWVAMDPDSAAQMGEKLIQKGERAR